eukprot:m51a1_g5909 putative ubiquitin-conjugating enzyme e2 (152) ;mRNA; f:8757-9599
MAGGGKRIERELMEFTKNPQQWISVKPAAGNVYLWKAQLIGPDNTPYEKGVFSLDVTIPPEYPFRPPKVLFTTKVYHPNVKSDGSICMPILDSDWSPQLKIVEVMLAIRQLIAEPNLDHPLEAEIAELYKSDKKAFVKTATEWTKKYAVAK